MNMNLYAKTHCNWLRGEASLKIVQIGKKQPHTAAKQRLISLQDCSEYSALINIQLHVCCWTTNFFASFLYIHAHSLSQPENMQNAANVHCKQSRNTTTAEDFQTMVIARHEIQSNTFFRSCTRKRTQLSRNLGSHVISYLLFPFVFQFFMHKFVRLMIMQNMRSTNEWKRARKRRHRMWKLQSEMKHN